MGAECYVSYVVKFTEKAKGFILANKKKDKAEMFILLHCKTMVKIDGIVSFARWRKPYY